MNLQKIENDLKFNLIKLKEESEEDLNDINRH